MKIEMAAYNPGWINEYEQIRKEIAAALLKWNPSIEHIGSTSVPGLDAKPIIDILVGLSEEIQLDKIIHPLLQLNYTYFEKYNPIMPYRRFFVKRKPNHETVILPSIIKEGEETPDNINDVKWAHIHVMPLQSPHWTRHIAFRNYLRAHEPVKQAYQELKHSLCLQEWENGTAYNAAKNDFIKEIEAKAVEWYHASAC